MFWRSVVGKLWFTILLLVSFVLSILTVLLLQFFESYHINEAENELTRVATKIAKIKRESNGEDSVTDVAWEMMDTSTKAVIIDKNGNVKYSPNKRISDLPLSYIKEDHDLSSVLNYGRSAKKVALPPIEAQEKTSEYIIVGVPVSPLSKEEGAIFIYQSLNVVDKTTKQTTKIILLSAGIAIVLTTVFAFFLSSRITAPLRKMREAATEMAKGKFNSKVPILTHDEIGELALAFNRMGRQIEFHIHALNHEKEQLTRIVSSMADGVITMNRKGEILLTNPPADLFLKAYSYEESNHMKNLPTELKHLLETVISEESGQYLEMSLQGRSWVILMTPLYDQEYVRGAVAVLRDMTEERRMDKLREDFIANVSHELRTPISMLQGYSEAIVDDIASTEAEKKEIAQVIYDESLRMGRLVNELLDIARMQSGHIQLQIENVLIEEFISKIARKFQGLAKEKNIAVLTNFTLAESVAQFDPDRIEQVLTNLIDNAIRHTNELGTVSVDVCSTNEELRIEVSDTGSGIPQEDLAFVFERFYKADKARTRGKAGTGLGLAIAKNIIEAHHGQIMVRSKVEEGTTFHFVIPLNNEKL